MRLMALALTMLFTVLAVAPTGAREGQDVSAQLRAGFEEITRTGGTRTQQETYTTQATSDACWSDPRGDTVNMSSGSAEPYAEADLVQWCAKHDGGSFVMKLNTASPTSPTSDPNWVNGMTAVSWGLDFDGDTTPEYTANFYNTGSAVVLEVYRWSDDQFMCGGTATFDGTYYVGKFPANCVGDPSSTYIEALVLYDSQWDNESAPVYADISDVGGGPISRPTSAEPAPAPAPDDGRSKYFADVTGGPHVANIDFIYEQGLINGCGTNPLRYCPGASLTRAQFATIMANYIRSQQ